MPAANPLPQLTLPRIQRLRQRVAELVWSPLPGACRISAGPSADLPMSGASVASASWSPIDSGHRFGGRFTYHWFQVDLPPQVGPEPRWIRWQADGEATIHVAGQPWAGIDVPHPRQLLPEAIGQVQVQVMTYGPDAVVRGCQLERRDAAAWGVQHDLEVLLDAAEDEARLLARSQGLDTPHAFCWRPALDRTSRAHRRLLHLLDQAADAFDRGGIAALAPVLTEAYRELPADRQRLRIAATGHAHLDLVWLWPEHAAAFKAVHTFSNQLRLLETYPEFRFGFSQPAGYDLAESLEPQQAAAVRAQISTGRWDAEGALQVEGDTLLPCGEALARCLLLGQEGFRRLTGRPSAVLWLPDCFGFSSCLPQLMRQCEVSWFFTTKLHWNPVTFFPHSSFRWQGDDGTEVVAHLAQHSMGYILDARLKELRNIEELYRQGAVHDEALAPIGHGDGGGGPTAEQIERLRRLGDCHFSPPAEWSSISGFADRLLAKRAALPAWHGELYLEYHRGCATSQHRVKQAYRALERALQAAEAVAVAGDAGPIEAEAWRRLCFAQFHDYLPGSSVRDVYRRGVPELEQLATAVRGRTAARLGTTAGASGWFNPLPQPWTGLVSHDGADQLVTLPPLSGCVPVAAGSPPSVVRLTGEGAELRAGETVVRLDHQGHLICAVIDGRPLRLAGPAAILTSHPDHPAMFDAWDIDRQTMDLGSVIDAPAELRLESPSSIAPVVAVSRRIGRHSGIVMRWRLIPGTSRIDLAIDLDWREPEHLLKLRFPTGYRGTHARFGNPFGSIMRPQRSGSPQAEAMWEVPGNRWASVADDGEGDGLWLASEARYGWSCRDGDLALSLVRSPISPEGNDGTDVAGLAEGTLADDWWARPFTDLGRHQIRLAIGQVAAGPHAAAQAELAFTEPVRCSGTWSTALRGIHGGSSLIPCWARPLGHGRWQLRLHEVAGRQVEARLDLAAGISATRVDLQGRPVAGGVDPLVVRPYEVVTVAIG